ncbi:MAG: hypothetical protein SPL50_00470 [Alloprevotella sp.]|nr:hypothetical protein [Alloprevotella sp.]
MENKYLILTAQVISLLFSPFHMPVVAFFLLLFLSYMSLLPLAFKVAVLVIVWMFTIMLPRLSIFAYRKLNGWSRYHLGRRANRFFPYLISIVCYASLLYLMYVFHMPSFTLGIILGALAIQVACALLNNWVKVSTHAAAAGGCLGALLAFSAIFHFDPTSWLCLCVLLCGLVSTSRLVLRQHQLRDVGLGTLVGVLCGFFCIYLV